MLDQLVATPLTVGPPRAVCAADRTVWVGHARGVVRWTIARPPVAPSKDRKKATAWQVGPPGAEPASTGDVPGAPVWEGRWLLPPSSPGLTGLRCDADRVVAFTTDGQRHFAQPEGLVLAPPSPGGGLADGLVEGLGRDQPAPIGLVPGATAEAAAADDEQAQVSAWGFGVQRGGAWAFWRRAPGGVGDAAYDGHQLWLAAASGLWRLEPGQGEPQPVALPPAIADQPLVRTFFDGAFLWVGTADGHGHPLRVNGQAARTMPRDGRLNPEDDGLLAPVGRWLARGHRGSPGLSVNEVPLEALGAGTMRALLPVAGDRLLVATDQAVLLVKPETDPKAPAQVAARWPQPGVIRLFAAPAGQVLAVTVDDGVFRLDVR